jgi:hypothetical protein
MSRFRSSATTSPPASTARGRTRKGSKGRRGSRKATVAVGHSILVAAHHILDRRAPYQDLGADYFLRRHDPERHAARLVRQLQAIGFRVSLVGVGTA